MTWRISPLALLVVALGCGGGSSKNGGGTAPPPPLSITITPATGVPADGTTSATIKVSAHDKTTGNPVSGEVVTLTASGSGNVITQPGPTDATGAAQGKIASTVPESKVVTATSATADVASATVVFVTPPSSQNATLSSVSGDQQSAPAGGILANPLVVKVVDPTGAPVTNVPVTFTVTSGGGVLSITQSSTDSNGQTSTTLRLGSKGDNTVTVIARGAEGQQLQGSPLVFHETAN